MVTAIIASSLLASDSISSKFIPSGAVQKSGGYMPMQIKLSGSKPDSVKKVPDGLTAPKYGIFTMRGQTYGVILDGDKLYVDSGHNGDYSMGAVEFKPQNSVHMGSAQLANGKYKLGATFYHFDGRENMADTLFYYGDYGYEVSVSLGGKTYTSFVAGELGPNTSLWIDRNGDGKRSYFHEMVRVGKPFNYTGTPEVIEVKGDKLTISKSSENVPLEPMAPSLNVGDKVLSFDATTTAGDKVSFPKSYAGKVVMIDFWATWCGPCMGEVPNVVAAYKKYHDQGFEILGISFDQENSADKVASVTKDKGMVWQEVYEGKFWNTSIGQMYDVAAIPFSLIVDGDSGQILATGDSIRGENLAPAIEKALAKKKAGGGK